MLGHSRALANVPDAPPPSIIHLSVTELLVVVVGPTPEQGVKTGPVGGGLLGARSVTIFNRVSANGGGSATEGTNVPDVVVTPPRILARPQAAKTPPIRRFQPALRLDFWADNLPKIYPPDRSRSLLDQLTHGVRIGRPSADTQIVSHNWASAFQYREQVGQIIADDLAANRLDGPYYTPPYPNYIISPLGAFPKRGSHKVRLIHDLSYPNKGSVNSSIKQDEFSLNYSSVDDATAICRQLGPGPVYMAKMDLESAFKHIFVDERDWHLLGFSWPDAAGRTQYFFSKVLNFGLRSSPFLFDLFAEALLEIMFLKGVPRTVVRYVDDFIVVAPSRQGCQDHLDTMIRISHEAGFSIQPSKITKPSTVTEFLGIVIDTEREEMRISKERMLEISAELDAWLDRPRATKRQILSLVGKLAFASKVVRSGRAFLARLIAASKTVSALNHHVKLSAEAKQDVIWWSRCIATHNGVGYYNPSWAHEGVKHVFSDASGLAMGALCGREWTQLAYVGSAEYMLGHSINWREFHAALTALATWADSLQGESVIFHIDNMTVCHILNSLYSPVLELMRFVRHWCLLVETFAIKVAVVYIDTHANIDADDLSRLRNREFLERNPGVSQHMTWPNQDFMSIST